MQTKAIFLYIGFFCLSTSFALSQDAEPPARKLFLHGGGSFSSSMDEAFLSLTGGKSSKLIVIPTAKSDESLEDLKRFETTWQKAGFEHVVVLHSRNGTFDEAELATLKDANAIWFTGGSQSRLAEAYLGTALEKKILELAKRGVPIGGSSAGTAIQSRLMIARGSEEPELAVGFDLLPNSILDQHFLERSRLNRLISAIRQHPEKTGVGIDEGTCLIVDGERGRVVGRSFVILVRLEEGELSMNSFGDGESFLLSEFGLGRVD